MNSCLSKIINLIPKATHRKAECLKAGVSECIAAIVVHEPAPGDRSITLSRTPPVAEVANIVACTIEAAVARRKGCKTSFIGSCCIRAIPMC